MTLLLTYSPPNFTVRGRLRVSRQLPMLDTTRASSSSSTWNGRSVSANSASEATFMKTLLLKLGAALNEVLVVPDLLRIVAQYVNPLESALASFEHDPTCVYSEAPFLHIRGVLLKESALISLVAPQQLLKLMKYAKGKIVREQPIWEDAEDRSNKCFSSLIERTFCKGDTLNRFTNRELIDLLQIARTNFLSIFILCKLFSFNNIELSSCTAQELFDLSKYLLNMPQDATGCGNKEHYVEAFIRGLLENESSLLNQWSVDEVAQFFSEYFKRLKDHPILANNPLIRQIALGVPLARICKLDTDTLALIATAFKDDFSSIPEPLFQAIEQYLVQGG